MTSISRPIGLAWSLRLALGLALLLALAAPWQPEAAAQQQAVIVNDLSTVELPPDIGQSEYKGTQYWDRTTVIVGPDAVVRKVYEKVSPQGHEQALLSDLKALAAKA